MARLLAANEQAANKRGTSYYTSSLLYHNRHTISVRVRMKGPGPGPTAASQPPSLLQKLHLKN